MIANKASTEGVAARPPLLALARTLLTFAVFGLPCSASRATDDPESVSIAVALPMSGSREALGQEIAAAIKLTLADLTARNLGSAPQLSISWHDDQCSSQGGTVAAQRILAQSPRPLAVVGHACPSAANAAAPLYSAAGLVVLVTGGLPARLSASARHGPFHFRMQAEGDQGRSLGIALADAGPTARIALVRDKTQFATSIMTTAAAALAAKGRPPALVETFAGGNKDFVALVQRLKAATITHVALAAFPSEAALLVTELRNVAPDISIIATDTLADPAFARTAGIAADGVEVAFAADIRAFPEAQHLAQRLSASGTTASRAALYSAAAIELVASAVTRGLAPELGKTLANNSFDTVLGAVAFDASGTIKQPSHLLYVWRGGMLQPPPAPLKRH